MSVPVPPTAARPRRDPTPYALSAGAAAYLLLLTGVPLARGAWLSLTDTRLLNPSGGSFVGMENYRTLIADQRFYDSLLTTLLYSGTTVAAALTLGTVSALAINEAFRGRTVARAILTLPWAAPTVAVTLVFAWIYNIDAGVANRGVGALGLGEPEWLIDPRWGLFSVTLTSVWKVFPFVMLVVLAALQSVPHELREAARVDGADTLNTFRAIVLPHLVPTLRIVTLLMTIWAFRRFEIIFLLTGGGPVDTTNTIVINVYREAFANSNLGRAAALGVLGLLLSLVVTVVYFLVERRTEQRAAA